MLLIVLTETWLREHLDAELAIQGYSIFRTDRDRRKKRRGRNSGGVAVFVRNDVNPQTEVLLHFSSGVIEALCLRMPILNLVLVAVYRQPNDSMGGNISTYVQFQEFIEKLSETLNNLHSPLPTLVIAGDFNLPDTSWPSCIPSRGASRDEKLMINLLQEFIANNFLIQIIDQPTHRGGNTLDLLFTNNADMFPCVDVFPSAFSSHKLVTASTYRAGTSGTDGAPTTSLNESGFDALNFFSDKVDWEKIHQELASNDWTAIFRHLSVSQMLQTLTDMCHNIASRYAPARSPPESPKKYHVSERS